MSQSFCADCEIGRYADERGLQLCHACNPGSYENETSARVCKKCPLGKSNERIGSQGDEDCVDCQQVRRYTLIATGKMYLYFALIVHNFTTVPIREDMQTRSV